MAQTVVNINSESNAQFRLWKSLLTSKGIKENQQFLLMGSKLIVEFLEKPPAHLKAEYILESSEFVLNSAKQNLKRTILSNDLFKQLDTLGTHSAMLVVSFLPLEKKDLSTNPNGLEIISPMGDPQNLGALTRSALALGVKEIILTGESCNPFLPKAVKASAGAVLQMKFYVTEKIQDLKLSQETFALDLKGTSVTKISWPKNLRLLVGEEGPGLNLTAEQKKQAKFVTIPTVGVESLNAMVSTSIAIWEWKKSSF